MPLSLTTPLDDIFRARSHVRVLRVLSQLPSGFGLSGRAIASRAGLAHRTAQTVLDSLSDRRIVNVRVAPRVSYYDLNREHALAEGLVGFFNRERGLFDELVKYLREQLAAAAPAIDAAYLFGSAARGEMSASSDVDLALVCSQEAAPAVEDSAADIAEAARSRYGIWLTPIVGSPSLQSLVRRDRPGHRLWQQIAADGVPVLVREDSGVA